jgi:GR25 family glycosyltransferase involved in LPS biosynthesis
MKTYKELISLIPAYCINLNRRSDRWEKAKEQFYNIDYPVTRWEATYFDKSPNNLSAGQAGCLESHRQVWKDIIKTKTEIAAVFEDDIVFSRDFHEVFQLAFNELPGDWDIFHLHSFRAETQSITERVVKLLRWGWGAHGYLIKADTCKTLLSLDSNIPADTYLMDEMYRLNKNVYGLSLPYTLAFQRGADSDIQKTSQQDFWREQLELYMRR